jgi:prolyl-tRNA synthetase
LDGFTKYVRRDTGESGLLHLGDVGTSVSTLLDLIQADMFDRARQVMVSRLCEVRRWEDLVPTLDEKCAVVLPWCENEICEKDIMKRTAEW